MQLRLLLLLPFGAAALLADDTLADQARKLYAAQRYPEARAALERLVAAEPNNAEAHYYLGDLAVKRDDTDEAVKQYEQAVALAPKNTHYRIELGGAYGTAAQKAGVFSKLGLAKKCRESLEQAEALEPDNLEARQALFSFYRAAPSFAGGGHDKAAAEAEEIRKRDPILGAYVLGQVYLDDKKVSEAFALYEEALKKAPDNYAVLYGLGRAAAQTGQQLERGEQTLRRCLTLTPGPGEAPLEAVHWRLGNIAERKGDKATAKAEYEAALKIRSEFKQAAESLAKLK